jgi:hypothetical protein
MRLISPALLSYLPWRAQVELEQFYQPHKDHTPKSLLAHQDEVTQKDPSLGNRVGKHHAQLVALTDALRERAANPIPLVTEAVPSKKRKVHTAPPCDRASDGKTGDRCGEVCHSPACDDEADGGRRGIGRQSCLAFPPVRIPHLHACSSQVVVNRSVVEAQPTSNVCQGHAAFVELAGFFYLSHLNARVSNLRAHFGEVLTDRGAVNPEALGELVHGGAGFVAGSVIFFV